MERTVDIYVHEQDMARMERSNARSHFLNVVLIIILLATNIGWLYYESQYTDLTTTYTQEADIETNGGGNAYVNNGGDLNYGTYQSQTDNNN